jgi:Flp pilus assembly protein TadG
MKAPRGQVLMLVAFSILPMLVLVSLAVDVGTWRYEQRLEQTAADSAALAGATESTYSSSLASITAAAQTDAASNGFTNGAAGVTVTVNDPPLAGAYASLPGDVEVVVARPLPIHFAMFGQSTSVSARAVAGLSTAGRNCIFALDASSSSSVTLDGGTITIPTCGLISNGGLLFNGGATVNAASIGYAGSGLTLNGANFPEAAPAPSVAAADPCPTIAGCAYVTANPPPAGGCVTPTTYNSSSTMTLSPGTYCQQVLTEGSGGVVFNPGVYNFESGFTNNSSPSMTGSGVTLYLSGGSLIVGSNTAVNLSAPTSGNTAGVLVYQPASNNSQFILNGTASGSWAGMIYVPTGTIIVDGGEITTSLLLVGNDLTFNGTSGINVSSSAFPGYAGHAVLFE